MSGTPVVVVPHKHGYGWYEEGHRHHAYYSCLNLVLRVLTAAATAAAIIVMLAATETKRTPYGDFKGRWRDYPAYKWFIIANSLVFVYACFSSMVAYWSLILRRGPLSYSGSAWLTFLADFVAACILMSSASATLAVALIARNGQNNTQWNTICNLVSRFCNLAQGAVITSFCAFGFLSLSTMLAASALHHLAWRSLSDY